MGWGRHIRDRDRRRAMAAEQEAERLRRELARHRWFVRELAKILDGHLVEDLERWGRELEAAAEAEEKRKPREMSMIRVLPDPT